MKIHLATWLFEPNHGVSLTLKGKRERLLSYYAINIQKITKNGIRKYCRTGMLETSKKASDLEAI